MGRNLQEMQRLAGDVEDFAIEGARFTIRTIHSGTVRRLGASPGTPVATGRARSGGKVRLNSPPTLLPPEGKSFYPITGADEIDRELAGMRLGDVIHWRNRVPYSGVLEGGRRFSAALGRMVGSEQAPDGFLGIMVRDELPRRLRRWRYQPRRAA